MRDLINDLIERALLTGKSLDDVQKELSEKNIKIDLNTLQRRTGQLKKDLILRKVNG